MRSLPIYSPSSTPPLERARSLRVALVDLTGEYSVLYTPLAIMSLKASLLADARVAGAIDVRLLAYTQQRTLAEMVGEIAELRPDVVGLSCQGWNFRQFAAMLPTLRQLLPTTLVVLGGNHVSGRGADLLPRHPEVDAIVDGEGELTLGDIVAARLAGLPLDGLAGVTHRDARGAVVSNPPRSRARDLGALPSPYSLTDLDLRRFDIALMETNRGCPYQCAYCFWGGAVGQKLARSEVERARVEIEAIAAAGIETLFLCDANFGILEQDVTVAEIVVDARRRHGAPRAINVNWAKNNAARVGKIIRILRDGGVQVPINIPLQTMSATALELANRGQTGRAAMMSQADELVAQGIEIAVEMIFALPGETLAEFRDHYDELFLRFPFLRIHPLWVLPSTGYDEKREELGIIGIRPDPTSDYEAILEHRSMSRDDVRDGLGLLMSHQILVHLAMARNALRVAVRFGGVRASECLVAFERFLATRTDPLGESLRGLFARVRSVAYFERALRDRKRQLVYGDAAASFALVRDFLRTLPLAGSVHSIVEEMARYDCALLPRSDLDGVGTVESVHEYSFDAHWLASAVLAEPNLELADVLASGRASVTVAHRAGLAKIKGSNCDLTGTWNGRIVGVRRERERTERARRTLADVTAQAACEAP